MRQLTSASASLKGHQILVTSNGSAVLVTAKAGKGVRKFDAVASAKLRRLMTRWCNGDTIHEEGFEKEGRSKTGQLLEAFKSHQHRLYGFECRVNGARAFIVVDTDIKKQTPASAGRLQRVGARVDKIV